MAVGGTRLKFVRWTIIIVFLAVVLTFVGVCRSLRNSTSNVPFSYFLSEMTNLPVGPKAFFEQPRPIPSKWLSRAHIGITANYRLWVFRHGRWTQLEPAEASERTSFDVLITTNKNGRIYARSGYSFKIDVPVCEVWKVELSTSEIIHVGPKDFSFSYKKKNVWQSPNLPGWSNIRGAFNSEAKSDAR